MRNLLKLSLRFICRSAQILLYVLKLELLFILLPLLRHLLAISRFVLRRLIGNTRIAQRLLPKKYRDYYASLPKEVKVGLSIPAISLGLLIVTLVIVQLVAYIQPGSLAYASYGIGEEYGDEQAYYCRHIIDAKAKSDSSLPVVCQSSEMLASILLPTWEPVAKNDGDKYAWGNCTYWTALRRIQIGRPIPNTWGDATYWATHAELDGYNVDHSPALGSIMQRSGGEGHVAFVESVDQDGTWHISEMNVIGYNEVDHRSMPAAAAAWYEFIH